MSRAERSILIIAACVAVQIHFLACVTTTPPAVIATYSAVATEATVEELRSVVRSFRLNGAVSDAQWAEWDDFELRFKAGFHGARLAVDSLPDAGDATAAVNAQALVNGFLGELAKWQLIEAQLLHPDGGAP